METFNSLEISKYDILDYYDKLLTQYYNVLYSAGLNRHDYKDISKIVRDLDKMRSAAHYDYSEYVRLNKNLLNGEHIVFGKDLNAEYIDKRDSKKEYLDEVESIRGHFENILELIRNSIKPSTIKEYLQEEVSITHLVFTNNRHPKIVLTSNDSFMFSCQYHDERTSSLMVANYKGYGRCLGCGVTFRVLDYLKHMEGLSDEEEVSLLSRVYMIDNNDNIISEDSELVQKYRSSLLSPEYRSLLERAYERTGAKEDNVTNRLALEKFKKDFATIDRVSRGEHIEFNGEMDKGKKLKLSFEDF